MKDWQAKSQSKNYKVIGDLSLSSHVLVGKLLVEANFAKYL